MRRIDPDRKHTGVEFESQRDRFSNGPASQALKIQQKSIGIEGLRPQHLAPRKCQKLLRELFTPPRGSHGGFSQSYHPFRLVRSTDHHVETANDDRKEIVEIVRDAACQLADGFHLLRLMKRFLSILPLGRVHHDAGHATRRAAAVAFDLALGCNPPHFAVGPDNAAFHVKTTDLRRLVESRGDGAPLFRNDMTQQLLAPPRR